MHIQREESGLHFRLLNADLNAYEILQFAHISQSFHNAPRKVFG